MLKEDEFAPRAESGVRESREILLYLLAVVTVVLVGTLGFYGIEGWPLFDAFYMTVITLSTVGYGEVHPLTPHGRLFAVALIFLGVGVATAVLPRLAAKIIENQIRWVFERKDMQEIVDRMDGHAILCGYGRLCQIAAKHLRQAGRKFVIVDKDEARVEGAKRAGFVAIKGDVTTEEALLAAGVKRAKQLVILMPKDSDNLYAIMCGRDLNPEIYIISRADDEASEKRLARAGAARVLSPYRIGGEKIASGLLRPFVTDFIDIAGGGDENKLQMEELVIPDGSPLAGASLHSAEIRKRTNVIIAALIGKNGKMIVNPAADAVLESGATLIALGQKKDFQILESMLVG